MPLTTVRPDSYREKKMDTLFLGIFNVVPCCALGFFVEYQLEHYDRKTKSQAIYFFIFQDLEIDNTQFDLIIPAFIEKDQLLDTLLQKIRESILQQAPMVYTNITGNLLPITISFTPIELSSN